MRETGRFGEEGSGEVWSGGKRGSERKKERWSGVGIALWDGAGGKSRSTFFVGTK